MASLLAAPSSLAAAPSVELVDVPPAYVESVGAFQTQDAMKVQAALEEVALFSDPLDAAMDLDFKLGATPSWEGLGLAAATSVGALGRAPSLATLPSTAALQGMMVAAVNPGLSAPALRAHAAELAPVAAKYGALGPAVSADGTSWIPASVSGASGAPTGGLLPASSASGVFATIGLACATSLNRSGGSGGPALLFPEGASPRCAHGCVRSLTRLAARPDKYATLCRVEDLVNLSRQPDCADAAKAYLSGSGIDLEPLDRTLNAPPGEAMTDAEFRDMLGLLRTLSVRGNELHG